MRINRVFLLSLGLAACARGPSGPTVTAPAASCVLTNGAADARDTVVIGLDATIDPVAAPVPRNASERFLYRQLYEPLVRVDCAGRVTPGLASSWRENDGGREWIFRLRPGARFWDGVPVTANDVRGAWLRRDTAMTLVPWGGPPEDAVRALGDTAIAVRLSRSYDAVPALFADPVLAVAKPVRGVQWPLGTGSYWIAPGQRLTAAPAFGDPLPALTLRSPSNDARDLLDSGADVVLTGDPAALRYAATRTDWRAVPLPWDRMYVVLSANITVPDTLGASLARDAVRADARAAVDDWWWDQRNRCNLPPASSRAVAPAAGALRVAYPRGDAVARDIAGRLVALGVGGRGVVAAGLTPDDMADAVRSGAAVAFVLPLPRTALDPCAAAADLLRRVPWLDEGDGFQAARLVPLIETRRHALVRGSVPGLTADWDGAVRVGP